MEQTFPAALAAPPRFHPCSLPEILHLPPAITARTKVRVITTPESPLPPLLNPAQQQLSSKTRKLRVYAPAPATRTATSPFPNHLNNNASCLIRLCRIPLPRPNANIPTILDAETRPSLAPSTARQTATSERVSRLCTLWLRPVVSPVQKPAATAAPPALSEWQPGSCLPLPPPNRALSHLPAPPRPQKPASRLPLLRREVKVHRAPISSRRGNRIRNRWVICSRMARAGETITILRRLTAMVFRRQ